MEFHQESNSFSPVHTVLEDYRRCSVMAGEELYSIRGKKLALAGMIQALEEEQAEIIPGFAMRAPAGGVVEHSVVELFLSRLREILEDAPPLDGCFFSFHGATQSTQSDDVCGDILREVRHLIGDGPVISASFDLHANISRQITECADVICGYQTYPHMDFFETGYRAAKLGVRCVRGEKLTMAWTWVPMIQPASGYTTEGGGLQEIFARCRQDVCGGRLEDFSLFQMQPWLDVPADGSAVVMIARDPEAARECAAGAARALWGLRKQMSPALYSLEQVAALAQRSRGKEPVIVSDFSDSPNAGAAGDSFAVAAYFLEHTPALRIAAVICDPSLVEEAFQAGVGAVLHTRIGGCFDKVRVKSFPVTAYVASLHDGSFLLEGPAMRGVAGHLGRTATLKIGQADVVVCTAMAETGDPQLFRHFGVEPSLHDVVAVKACTSYRAAYSRMSQNLCPVDTRCAATADLLSLPFRKLPKSLFPFSDRESPAELEHVYEK